MRRAAHLPLALALLVAAPHGAIAATVRPAAATVEQLDDARGALGSGTSALDQARSELETADLRAAGAGASLAALRDELAAAEARLAAADDAEREATTALTEAVAALERDDDAVASVQDTVSQRAAAIWMRGTGSGQVLAAHVLGPGDLHDVLVRARAVGAAAADDRAALATGRALQRRAARGRDATARARTAASAAAEAAAAARAATDALVSEQQRATTEADAAASARRAAVARIEGDVAARAALVAALEQRLADERAAARSYVGDAVVVPVDGPVPQWADALPAAGRSLAPAVVHAAGAAGVEPRLLAALVWTESGFAARAVSPAGAIGLTQLMPATAAGLGVDPSDPEQNLLGGARYLRQVLDRFGRVDLALAAYNAGPGRVEAAGAVPDIVETQLYVLRVLERLEQLGG